MKFNRIAKVLLFLTIIISSANGQWKMLKDFGAQVYSIHFLDRQAHPKIGFVGLTDGEVWRTSDAGLTWNQTTTPPTLIGSVRDFSFKDSLTGFLCAFQNSASSACFKTTDAGITWNPLPPTGEGMAVYYNPLPPTGVVILSQWTGVSISTDLGTSWTPVAGTSNMNNCGIAFTDTMHGLITVYPTGPNPGNYLSTTDGGLTWANETQTLESWQPLGIKGTGIYFICAEGVRQILRSNNYGKTWTQVYQFPLALNLSGDIRGDLAAMYVQSKDGTQYSVDQGQTWTDYCGPKNDFDTRMYNVSDSLYAGTLDGQLWLNPFGVKKNNLLLQIPTLSYNITSGGCLSVDSIFHLFNLSNCLPVKIQSIAIPPGVGAKQFAIKLPASLPRTIPDTSAYNVKITYTPDDSFQDSATMEIKYTVGSQSYTVDVKLHGLIKPGFNVTLSKNLNLLLSSDCAKVDTSVFVKSGVCGADTITAISLSDPTAFTLTNPTLPAGIDPAKSLSIPVSVKAVAPGVYNTIVKLTILSGGITRDTFINISATILSSGEPRTNLSPGLEKFDTVSVCAFALDTIILKNTICKKLYIKNISVQPASLASEFTIVNGSTLPDSLSQDDTAQAIIQYKPSASGKVSGTLCFTIGFDLTNTKDTCIAISGIGKALASSALSESLLNFAPIVPCTTAELSTRLYNNSCGYDTIVTIIPSSDKSFSVVSPAVPLTIASGDSTDVKIQEDPLSPGGKFDSVRIVIHSSSGSVDTVDVKVAGTVNKPIHKLNLDALLQLDSLAPCTAFDTLIEIKNLGLCDTLVIDSLLLKSQVIWINLINTTLPAKILPGNSFFYTLRFTPGGIQANGFATIHIKGIGIDTIVTVHGDARKGGSILSVTADSLFISTLCKPASHTFTLQNTSCDPLIFDQLSFKNNLPVGVQYSITPPITLPVTIQPGSKQDFVITFDPTLTGDSLAIFAYQSSVSGISRAIRLIGKIGSTKQTARLGLLTDANQKQTSIPAGSTVKMNLLLEDNIDPTLGLQSAKASLAYFDNVLNMIGTPTAGAGWTLNSSSNPSGSVDLDLSPNGAGGLSAGSVIASVKFEAFVSDSAFTPVNLQNVQFNKGDQVFATCVLSPLVMQSPDTIFVSPDCGNKVIRGFMNNDKTVFSNIVIRPNPVSSGKQIQVSLDLNAQTEVTFNLRDALGRSISTVSKSFNKGHQQIRFDLPKEGSGFYILSTEAGGRRESRKVIIEE
jgi:photosystem II stability/assembly factor-like uncharacterized protein